MRSQRSQRAESQDPNQVCQVPNPKTGSEPVPSGSSLESPTRISLTTRRAQVKLIPGMLQVGALADASVNLERHSPSSAASPHQQRAQPRRLHRLCPASATVTAVWEPGLWSPSSSKNRPLLRRRSLGFFTGRTGRLGQLRALWLAPLLGAGLTINDDARCCASFAVCVCVLLAHLLQALASQEFVSLGWSISCQKNSEIHF